MKKGRFRPPLGFLADAGSGYFESGLTASENPFGKPLKPVATGFEMAWFLGCHAVLRAWLVGA